MDSFDLIGALKSYSNSLNWHFLYGTQDIRNYEATEKKYSPNDLILACDPFEATPSYTKNGSKLTQITYQGFILLGRKRESLTESSLDETYIQKYDNRLKNLLTTLSNNLIAFSCLNELTIQSATFGLFINQMDENIDFVGGSITFLQEL